MITVRLHTRSPLKHRRRRPVRGVRTIGALAVLIVATVMWSAAPASAADPVVAAAGDIACQVGYPNPKPAGQCHEANTAALVLATGGLSAVLPVGDLQYECGSSTPGEWNPFDTTWGAFKSKMFPVPGNHEYDTATQAPNGVGCDAPVGATAFGSASGYRAYFNKATDPAVATAAARTRGSFPMYYSYELGAWHVVALNTNSACASVGCRLGSVQEKWLKADLAAHPAACTLAYLHHPFFSSKTPVNAPGQLIRDLYDAGADVVLSGHVHSYERFAQMDPLRKPDPRFGIRAFVIGTGGRSTEAFTTVAAGSEVRLKSFGILRLTLHPTSYDWQFVPDGTAGSKIGDSGTTACHGLPDFAGPTVTVTSPANGSTVRGATTLAANAADPNGVAKVDFLVDGTLVGSSTAAPFSAPWNSATVIGGSHTISARAFDTFGNQTTASVTVTVDNSVPVVPGQPGSNIFRIGINGAGKLQVTNAPADVSYGSPAWSRRGNLIAFSGPTCAGCTSGIFLVAPNGTGLRLLAGTPVGATRPGWGRLDRTLTFVGGTRSSVFTIGRNGRGLRRLTAGALQHDRSAISPNGRQIAFTTQQRNGGWDIWLMNANGSRKRNLTRSLASEVQPAWAPNGTAIAFTRQVRGASTIFVKGLGTGKAGRLRLVIRNCQQPAWSPNGRLIACTRFTATGSRILIFRANGRLLRRVPTGTVGASSPSWSANGKRIAFVSAG